MTALPHTVKDIDLLKWVKAHPNEPFDPPMVVATTGHTSDWEWQAVVAQMEDLARQTYITKLKQDPQGSTYWTITGKGENYLGALEKFEKEQSAPESQGETSENSSSSPASQTVPTLSPPVFIKSFTPANISLNATTTLSFGISNPNSERLTGISFTDILPTGLVISNPNNLVGSWASGELIAVAGSDRITLSNATLAGGESCTFQVSIRAIVGGAKHSVSSAISSLEAPSGLAASADLIVSTPSPSEAIGSSNWLDQTTINRFSDRVREVLSRADQIRSTNNRPAVSTLHLAVALAERQGSQLFELMQRANVSLESLTALTGTAEEPGAEDVPNPSDLWKLPRPRLEPFFALEQRHATQELARRLNVRRETIVRWEKGRQVPNAPADNVMSFNLTVTDAALFDSGGKRYPLLLFSRTFELRQLRLASTLAISAASIDPATASSLEMGLSTPRLTIYGVNGGMQQLTETTTPSVTLTNSQITLPVNFSVAAGQSQGVMLDFDIKNSLSIDANGNYLITPVLKSALTGTGGNNELSMSLVKIAAVQAAGNSMDVQVPTIGDTIHVKVDANTEYDPLVGQFSTLKAGQMIELEAKFQPDGTYLAKYVNQGAPDQTLRFQGVIMDVNQNGTSTAIEMVTR